MHHACIMHLDLKPDNIFINDAGPNEIQLKIGDFGSSFLLDHLQEFEDSFSSLCLNMTETYKPPEYQVNYRHFSFDIWNMSLVIL